MDARTAAALLDAWEAGLGRPGPARALALLAAMTGEPADTFAALPVGACDARLLALRGRLFGATTAAVADCPACGGRAEFPLDTGALLAAAGLGADALAGADVAPLTVAVDDWTISVRLPTAGDLVALARTAESAGAASAGDASADAARRALLARCVLAASHGGRAAASVPAAASVLPEPVVAHVAACLAAADAAADLTLDVGCPACGHRWEAPVDAGAFVWTELDAWATRTLRDVHRLARSYGWTEREVLALGETRRRLYVELAEGA